MFKTIVNAFKQKEVRNKLLLTLLLLFIYRLGCWIPLPGIDISIFQEIAGTDGNSFLALLSAVSGGALYNGAILALGVSPYITASIIRQNLQFFQNGGHLRRRSYLEGLSLCISDFLKRDFL